MESHEPSPNDTTALQDPATGSPREAAAPRHFLTGAELSAIELDALLARAAELKADPLCSAALAGRSVALIFEKPSTRTRVSFEVGIHELGGHAVVLRSDELQLSRGESPRDTALVLSRHVAAVGLRTGADDLLEELAAYSTVPIVNMLSARHHPCQALADLLTLRESYGSWRGCVSHMWATATTSPARSPCWGRSPGCTSPWPPPPATRWSPTSPCAAGAGGRLTLHSDPYEAVAGACAVYTDVWVSMGDEATVGERREALADYRVDDALLDAAAPGAFAMHDLPAHPGEEITPEVMYGPRQRIWEQAENRRHAQKALLEWLIAEAADRDGAAAATRRAVPTDLA